MNQFQFLYAKLNQSPAQRLLAPPDAALKVDKAAIIECFSYMVNNNAVKLICMSDAGRRERETPGITVAQDVSSPYSTSGRL